MLQRKISLTQDGSQTLYIPEWNESYHSQHGAIQEAKHVYIKNGIDKIHKSSIQLLEYGFGTGLNAFLTAKYAVEQNKNVHYWALEKYPINFSEVSQLNFPIILEDEQDFFGKIHRTHWELAVPISSQFTLTKLQQDFRDFQLNEKIDIVYFDVFGYRVQPYLWSLEIFEKIFSMLSSGGLLTTYCSKGEVRRNLQQIGFKVEKLAGPKGKREMINAWKP